MNYMTRFSDILADCRASNDWTPLVQHIPFAQLLKLRIDANGDAVTCIMPFDQKLIGNPLLPALHGGSIGGFLECAGMMYLLMQTETRILPKTLDFNIDYLRSGKPQDTFAKAVVVKLGRRVAKLRMEAWQSSADKPIALGHCTFMLEC